ncbi:hypothetical protein C7S15_8916 (plasmid) [Burkholderia cepacia]|nr:hypothetical protein [Burkholderia cepacia]
MLLKRGAVVDCRGRLAFVGILVVPAILVERNTVDDARSGRLDTGRPRPLASGCRMRCRRREQSGRHRGAEQFHRPDKERVGMHHHCAARCSKELH